MPDRWPFTGRDAELRTLHAVLARHGTVVLAGEAGVGKSRLARELVARAAGPAGHGVAVASASSRDIPLGALAPWLDPGHGAAGNGTAGNGTAGLGADGLGADGLGADGLGADGHGADGTPTGHAIAALRAHGPTWVLLVDDAHQLDPVSATVIGQLATARAVRLVLTLRTGEPCPDAVTAVWKDDGAVRHEVTPLGAPEVGELVRAALDGPIDARAEQRLHAVTRGNVLWLRHLVEGERASGHLTAVDGTWQWNGDVTLSPALSDLLGTAVGALTDPERRALELLSLAEPLGLDLLARLTGDDVLEAVSERGLVTVVPDGSRWEVRLAHPLYGEVVRSRMGVPRSRRLRGELSAALSGTGGRRAGDGLRRAVLDLGSDRRPEPGLLLAAALQASGMGDFALAERLLRAAVDAGGGFEVHLGLAHLLGWLLRPREGEVELARAVAAAVDDSQRVRATIARAYLLQFLLDRPAEATAAMADVEAQVGPTAGHEFEALRAAVDVSTGDLASARPRATASLAHEGLSDQATALATWAAAYLRAFSGRGEPLTRLVDRGVEVARRNPETAALQANIGYAEILDADLRGEPDAARRRLDWVHALPGPFAPTLAALYDGRAAMSAGLPRTAIRLIESALPAFPGHGGGWTAWLHALIARCHGMLGRGPAARASIGTAVRARHPTITAAEWEIDLARAWACAAEGSPRDGIRHCATAADDVRRSGMAAVEVLLRHTAVRFGDRGQAARLRSLAEEVGSPRARLAAAHAAALAAGDAARLLAVATDLEEAGMGLEGADTAAQSAALARVQGHLALASAAEERARALTGDDARTPAVLDATAPLALSSREREVATLAGNGLTNRQIAEHLQVSVRTVESHVYRACTRLGLADRAALVAVVVPPARPRPGPRRAVVRDPGGP